MKKTLFLLTLLLSFGFCETSDFEIFKKAYDDGDVKGCFNLGFSYCNGKGVKQDFKKAKEYFGKACGLRFQKGCVDYKTLNEQGY
ncbi:MAG: hypothetical protein LBF71_00460 [Campylobacteraceae bacterium]|jgi:TPR repeat protein|nr:hypothetical protein [Campylobacteraceae bacterium]